MRKANRPPCSRRDNNKKRESATSVGCFLLLFFNISLKSQKKACRLFFLTIKMSWYGLYQQQNCSICKIKTSRKLKQLLSARLVFTQSSLFERFKKKKNALQWKIKQSSCKFHMKKSNPAKGERSNTILISDSIWKHCWDAIKQCEVLKVLLWNNWLLQLFNMSLGHWLANKHTKDEKWLIQGRTMDGAGRGGKRQKWETCTAQTVIFFVVFLNKPCLLIEVNHWNQFITPGRASRWCSD